jgi:hypothetical protein
MGSFHEVLGTTTVIVTVRKKTGVTGVDASVEKVIPIAP